MLSKYGLSLGIKTWVLQFWGSLSDPVGSFSPPSLSLALPARQECSLPTMAMAWRVLCFFSQSGPLQLKAAFLGLLSSPTNEYQNIV